MSIDTSTWPQTMQKLAEALEDPELVLRLVEAHGNTEKIYIPKADFAAHPFTATIGAEGMEKLAKAFGGQRIDIVSGTHRKPLKTQIMDDTGKTAHIARRLGCSGRYVRKIREQLKNQEPLPLFPEE